MKRYTYLICAILILGIVAFKVYRDYNHRPAERHIHAGFIVFVDGKQVDFSNIRYMSLKPCEEHKENVSKEEIEHEKAHLHDNVGFVAHSHREEALWQDLFKNIHYSFDASKKLVGYVNGKPVENIFNYPINPYDSVVILVGNSDPKLITKAITKQQIINVEKTSQDCGS